MPTIEYSPVAGLTILEALRKARMMACKDKSIVVANINDVIVCISPETDVKTALQSYRQKLDFKYEIEKIKRTRQK